MVDNNTAMILCSVLGLIVLLGITVLIRHCNNKDYDEMRLNAPLIEMEKHDRHEAATRYRLSQSIGSMSPETVESNNALGSAERPTLARRPARRVASTTSRTLHSVRSAVAPWTAPSPLSRAASTLPASPRVRFGLGKNNGMVQGLPSCLSRLLRVAFSRRKEWVRKVDVDGNPFWFRGDGADVRFPGFVASFKTATTAPVAESGERALVTDTLLAEAKSLRMEIVDASKTNAGEFPLGSQLDSPSHLQEVIAMASSEFPVKYASFAAKAAAMMAPFKKQMLQFRVGRRYLLEQSLENVSCLDAAHTSVDLKVKFLGEKSAIGSNFHAEWFLKLSELLANPSAGVFTCTNPSDQTFSLNANSRRELGDDHLTFFYGAGRLLGRGLLQGSLWGFHLSLPLLKQLLGQPVSFSDLQFSDPETYKSMFWILENNVDALALDFSIVQAAGQDGAEPEIVDLIPNGRTIAVTEANKLQYLERKFQYMVFESVESQLYAFLKGVYEVVPQDVLMALDAEELDFVLCGSDVIDVDDWETQAKYTETLQGHPSKKWFWQLLRTMPLEHKRCVLHLATGHSRVPIGGFAALTNYSGHRAPFTLDGVEMAVSNMIRGQPCFNRLELPTFVRKSDLKTHLDAIIEHYAFVQAQ